MRVKEDFVVRDIEGTYIVIPMGERILEFGGMIELNETGAFLWRLLEKECTYEELVEKLMEEYEVEKETAKESVKKYLVALENKNILEGER